MNLKETIRRVLREEVMIITEVMIPTSNDLHENGENNYIVIAQDDNSNDFLLLFVELHKENDGSVFSYYFQVFNEGGIPITKRLYKREDALKFLPQNIKTSIIPLVKQMTIRLINRLNPNIINRVSMEFLNNKMMGRYDEISELLQKELGYVLIWRGKNEEGKDVWKFRKNDIDTELTEETISHFYTFNGKRLRKSLEEAEVMKNELIKKNWDEHRRLDREPRK